MSTGTVQSAVRNGIRIRKAVVIDGVQHPIVKLSIESTNDTPVAIRVREDLPDGHTVGDLGLRADYDGYCWQLVADDAIEFSRTLAPGESTLAAYTLYGSVENAQQFNGVPTIDAVSPVDPEDLGTGTEHTPLWRTGRSETGSLSSTGTDSDRTDGLVVIPAYNEEQSIASVVTEVRTHADDVVVIDDGSSDGTSAAARSAGATVIRNDRNEGYGATLKRAFAEAKRRDVAWAAVLDGDGQHDPADLPELLDRKRTENADIVIGSRFVDGGRSNVPRVRGAGLWVINQLTNVSMGTLGSAGRIHDTQSGFRLYGKQAIDVLADDEAIGNRMGASIDVLHCARRCDLSIEEVGTTISYDVESESTHNPIGHGFDLLTSILRTAERDHPLASLGTPGLVSLLCALYIGYTTAIGYGQMGSIPPSVLLAFGMLFFVGLFACFAAIVSHVLNLRAPTAERAVKG